MVYGLVKEEPAQPCRPRTSPSVNQKRTRKREENGQPRGHNGLVWCAQLQPRGNCLVWSDLLQLEKKSTLKEQKKSYRGASISGQSKKQTITKPSILGPVILYLALLCMLGGSLCTKIRWKLTAFAFSSKKIFTPEFVPTWTLNSGQNIGF